LVTDWHPQGKDLYDAMLLAEYTTVPLDLVRELVRPEIGDRADDLTAESVLTLAHPIDWDNFRGEYPGIVGDPMSWQGRLAEALARAWRSTP
jgi:hypothetical protein